MKTKTLYKFMDAGLKSASGKERDWKIGGWRKEDNIDICNRGFHASQTPLQALGYVKGEIVAEVEVRGESIIHDDKECWSEMRVVKAWHWKKKDSVALAIFAAEQVLKNYEKKYPEDTRPRDAIEAAKKVLADDTEKNRSAASAAAWSAAASAAAWSAAASASASAAWSAAASAAAWSAAASASASAAWFKKSAKAKLIASLDKWFLDHIKTLEPYV